MASITFTCYACNQTLKVGADKAGKKAKCVKCGTILTIPAAPPEEPEELEPIEEERIAPRRGEAPGRARDYDDQPRRRPRDDYDDDPRRKPRDDYDGERDRPGEDYDDRARPQDYGKVQIGLFINFIASCVQMGFAGLLALSSLFFLLALLAKSGGLGKTAMVIGSIAGILYVLLAIPYIVGYVFCIFTSNKNAALALGISTLSLGGVNLILKIVFILVPIIRSLDRIGTPGELGPFVTPQVGNSMGAFIVGLFLMLLMDAEWILFPLYMRATATNVHNKYATQSNMVSMIMAASYAGLHFVLMLVMVLIVRNQMGMGQGIAYMIALFSLLINAALVVFSVFYFQSIARTHKAVARA